MARWAWAIGSGAGLLVGLLVASFLLGAFYPSASLPGPVLERLPTSWLARILIPRQASEIVADSRSFNPGGHGVWLYEQPRAHGGYFCRFIAHYIPYGDAEAPRLDPKTEERYGSAGDPAELVLLPPYVRLDRAETTCRNFRDFEHALFEPHEAAVLVAAALRDGTDRYNADHSVCIDRTDLRRERPCNAPVILKGLKLHDLASVERLVESFDWEPAQWTFLLTFVRVGPHGHPNFVYVTASGRGRLSRDEAFRDADWRIDSAAVQLGGF